MISRIGAHDKHYWRAFSLTNVRLAQRRNRPLPRQSTIMACGNILCTKVDTTFRHCSSEPIDHIAVILLMRPTPTFRKASRDLHLDWHGSFYDGCKSSDIEMRPLIQRWTPEDDERLRLLVAQGASLIRATAALKRRQSVVRERANKLGCPFPTIREARKKWTNTPDNDWRA
jgi:hypothetical protein